MLFQKEAFTISNTYQVTFIIDHYLEAFWFTLELLTNVVLLYVVHASPYQLCCF